MNAVDAVAGLETASGADAQEAGRARFAERYDAPVFDKFADLLAASVPDVAAICTMEYPRYDLTMQAIEAGVRAIVLEKPMARTVMEAREMVAAAESRGFIWLFATRCAFPTSLYQQNAPLTAVLSGLRISIGRPRSVILWSKGRIWSTWSCGLRATPKSSG